MKVKRFFSAVLASIMLFALCGYFPNKKGISNLSLTADAANVENIVARADYLYSIKWTPQKSILTFDGKTFTAGKSYRLPYGMPVTPMGFIGYDISVDDFLNETKNANSKLYSSYSYFQGMRSPYYSMDCSTFVSWCWGLSQRQTTDYLKNYADNLGACTTTNISKIKVGDALNSETSVNGHVRLVTGISDGKYEITEMTPDVLKRETFTKSELASYSVGYHILRPTEFKTNTVRINYNTNGGTISSDKYYSEDNGDIYKTSTKKKIGPKWEFGSGDEDGLYNASTFGLSRKGYTFLGWSTSKSGGKIFDQDDTSLTANDIYPDIATKSGTVTMYAQWKKNTLTINYNTNGGTVATNEKYYAKDGKIYNADGTLRVQKWGYNSGGTDGLINASTFYLTQKGFKFLGWSTSKSGGKIYDPTDTSLTANDIYPDITTKSATVTMYAQWEKNILTMNYNTNGGQISENETYYAVSDGNIYRKSDSKIFSVKWGHDYEAESGLYNASTFNLTRPGYKFTGWSLSKTDGTVYDQNDNTIRAATLFPDIYTKSGKVMLYAQWKENTVTINYNTNGGTISSDSDYYAESNGNIYEIADKTAFAPKWNYTYESKYGLTNASTFKLTREGYTFLGWSTSPSGGKIFDQDDLTIRTKDLFSDILTKSGTVTMYAQWKATTTTTTTSKTTTTKKTTTTAKTTTTKKSTTTSKTTTKATTTTTKPVTTTTTATPPTTSSPSAGDANCDGQVLLNDAILILQYLGNPDAYPLSDEAKANADVSGNGDGLTNKDALAIQRYILHAIPSLPET